MRTFAGTSIETLFDAIGIQTSPFASAYYVKNHTASYTVHTPNKYEDYLAVSTAGMNEYLIDNQSDENFLFVQNMLFSLTKYLPKTLNTSEATAIAYLVLTSTTDEAASKLLDMGYKKVRFLLHFTKLIGL